MMLALLLASDEDPVLRAWLRTFDRDFCAAPTDVQSTWAPAADIDDFHLVIGAAMLGLHDDNPREPGARSGACAAAND